MKYQVVREVTINAGIETVRSYVADFTKWAAWSPWSVIEPEHDASFSGSPGQEGASMEWKGEIIGAGKMTLESVVDDHYRHDLAFFSPWKSQAKAIIWLIADGDQTKVTWTMNGRVPIFLFFMIGMMKAWIGMDYERGLTMLKELAEKGKVDARTRNVGVVDFDGFSYVGLANLSHMKDMPSDMKADFGRIMADFSAAPQPPAHAVTIYSKVKMAKQLFSYISAVSDEGASTLTLADDYVSGRISSQKMLEIRHRGSYRFLGNAWSMGHMVMRARKMKHNGPPFEYYHNGPAEVDESELLTSIYFPIKG